jgi:hypothetical protein
MRRIQEASKRELFGLYLDLENYIDEQGTEHGDCEHPMIRCHMAHAALSLQEAIMKQLRKLLKNKALDHDHVLSMAHEQLTIDEPCPF